MKKQLLNLTMLLLVLLTGGVVNAFGADKETVTIFSQDYESATASDWTSPNAQSSLSIGENNGNKYNKFAPGSQNNRNAYLWFGNNLKLSELDSYKLSLRICVNVLPNHTQLSEWMIVGEKSTIGNNSNHTASSNYYLVLSQKAKGSAEYTVQVGTTTLEETVTLTVGQWYTITQEISESKVKTVINDGSKDIFTNENKTGFSEIGHLKGINITSGRYYGEQFVDDILVTKEVEAGNVEAPTYSVTGVNGTSRTISVASATESVSFLWSETAPAENEGYSAWTEVTGNSFDTKSPAVYVVAKKDAKYSEVTTVTTTAGTEEKMPNPVITRTGANTYTISVAEKTVDGLKITPAIHYTVGTESKTADASSVSLNNVNANIKTWVTAEGLKGSDEITCDYVEAAVTAEQWSVDLNSYIRSNSTYTSFTAITSENETTIGEWSGLHSFNGQEKLYMTNNNEGWLFRPANTSAAFKCQSDVEGFVIDGLTTADLVEIEAANDKGGTIFNSLENSEIAYSYNDYNFFVVPTTDGAIKINFRTGTRIVAVREHKKVTTLALSTDYLLSTYTPTTDVDLTNEAGVKFYAAKVNGTSVQLTEVTGKVKARTGLLVENNGKAESVTLATASDGADVANNDLVGVTEEKTAAELAADNAYILVSDTQFQKVGTSTAGTLAKGKAYLRVNATSAARLLTIGNPTAISGVTEKADNAAAAVYNLYGMRVEKATSGLYIINGKKYIKK